MLYGKSSGYEMEKLQVQHLVRKKLLCTEVLDYLNKVEQGLSFKKGNRKFCMLQLHAIIRFDHARIARAHSDDCTPSNAQRQN